MRGRRNYPLVRAIAFVLQLMGWIALALGIIAGVMALTNLNASAQFVRILSSIGLFAGPLTGIVWWVVLYAFGSVLKILVDIEENTRLLASEPTATNATVEAR